MPRAHARARLAAALLALALTTTACTTAPMPTPTPTPSSASPAPVSDGVLRIGTLFPTTGSTKFLGAAQVAGVNAAVRELNKAGGVGGVPIEVVNRNSGDTTTDTAEKSFAELVGKDVDVVIGPSSSAIAERLLPLAAEARIPLISPAATFPQLTALDTTDSFFRTVPSYERQGTALGAALATKGARKVSVISTNDDLGRSLVATLEASLDENEIVLFKYLIAPATDVKLLAGRIKAAAPDSVVLVTPDNGDKTKSILKALNADGMAGAKLWLTSQNLADYSQALPKRTLDKANGIIEGVMPDAAFSATLKREDPGLKGLRYGTEAYDAVVLAALAAVLADDDSGVSITEQLRAVSKDGIKCTSFGECLDVLLTQTDIDYDGITGSIAFDAAGERQTASYGLYTYTAQNKPKHTGDVAG